MPSAPDWRSASAYAYVHELNRRELAWEYLRRNPSYKRDYRGAVHQMESIHIDAFALRWGGAVSLSTRICTPTTPLWFGCHSLILPPFFSFQRPHPSRVRALLAR